MSDTTDSAIIRDDAIALAHALNLVVEAYVRPYPFPFPEETKVILAKAAYEAGRALGNHSRLKSLYKIHSD